MGMAVRNFGTIETEKGIPEGNLKRVIGILEKAGAADIRASEDRTVVEFMVPGPNDYEFMERIKPLLRVIGTFTLAVSEFVESGEGYFYDSEEKEGR